MDFLKGFVTFIKPLCLINVKHMGKNTFYNYSRRR